MAPRPLTRSQRGRDKDGNPLPLPGLGPDGQFLSPPDRAGRRAEPADASPPPEGAGDLEPAAPPQPEGAGDAASPPAALPHPGQPAAALPPMHPILLAQMAGPDLPASPPAEHAGGAALVEEAGGEAGGAAAGPQIIQHAGQQYLAADGEVWQVHSVSTSDSSVYVETDSWDTRGDGPREGAGEEVDGPPAQPLGAIEEAEEGNSGDEDNGDDEGFDDIDEELDEQEGDQEEGEQNQAGGEGQVANAAALAQLQAMVAAFHAHRPPTPEAADTPLRGSPEPEAAAPGPGPAAAPALVAPPQVGAGAEPPAPPSPSSSGAESAGSNDGGDPNLEVATSSSSEVDAQEPPAVEAPPHAGPAQPDDLPEAPVEAAVASAPANEEAAVPSASIPRRVDREERVLPMQGDAATAGASALAATGQVGQAFRPRPGIPPPQPPPYFSPPLHRPLAALPAHLPLQAQQAIPPWYTYQHALFEYRRAMLFFTSWGIPLPDTYGQEPAAAWYNYVPRPPHAPSYGSMRPHYGSQGHFFRGPPS